MNPPQALEARPYNPMAEPEPISALRAALLRAAHLPAGLAEAPLLPLPDKGLAHLHLRLQGTGLLLRVPKQSQLGLPPAEHLAYEAACFERAAASGHTPRLQAVLPPGEGLTRGALVVDEIVGQAARLPADMPAVADALAALHRLPMPAPEQRAPLLHPAQPLRALLEEIEQQARHVAAAALAPGTLRCIENELGALRLLAARVGTAAAPEQPPQQLIAFDAHPGNYVVRADGRAMLVDLEKARYGPAALDLAHASLYTSTTWDTSSHAVLSRNVLADFHLRWLAQAADAAAQRRWIVPLRRAMWLWSLTWCAKWRAMSGRSPSAAHSGEDWSGELSDATLVNHVRERVDHYLSPACIAWVLDDTAALERALAD